MTLVPKWTGSIVDRERLCEHCKERKAVVLFDRVELCALCYGVAERRLIEEGRRKAGA